MAIKEITKGTRFGRLTVTGEWETRSSVAMVRNKNLKGLFTSINPRIEVVIEELE